MQLYLFVRPHVYQVGLSGKRSRVDCFSVIGNLPSYLPDWSFQTSHLTSKFLHDDDDDDDGSVDAIRHLRPEENRHVLSLPVVIGLRHGVARTTTDRRDSVSLRSSLLVL